MTSVGDQARETTVAQVFPGGGEMGALMRAHDWAATPLGPVEDWSPSLCTMVKILLSNRFPLLLWWGPQQCQLYNDAYRPVLGAKHPCSLGQPARECWPEIWHIIGPLIETPYEGGPATWDDDLFLEVNRHGFVEETHFTVAYSPVPDESVPGGIGGVLATVHEITQQVIQERRLAVLRDLGAGASDAKTAEEACAIAAAVLERHPKDVPFALMYLAEVDQRVARLAATAGASPGPAVVDLGTEGEQTPWPLAAVVQTDQAKVVASLRDRIDVVPPGPWSDPPEQALVLPVPSTAAHRPAGVLVLGLSARLALDEQYRSFGALVAGQIGTAIVNARAYEEERRRAEALAELDRAKTAFFSNVSHEFRTPLTLLLGPLEEALAAPPETPLEAERAQLESAHRNSLRLLRLVNTLLDFSRIEAGRAEASYEPTDLAALTSDLASVFRSAVERAGLRLIVDCPPLLQPVYVDREMWEKIVLNLLSNAFKFTFAGEIALVLRAAGDAVTLEVRDTGTGITAEELPHLFERFHRIRGARARTHEGTGIGLALVRELVTLHGGTIDVQSVVDGGTTFTVRLPLGAAHLPTERIGAARALASTALGAAPYLEEALRWLPDAGATETPATLPVGEAAPPDAGVLVETAPAARVLLADDNADMRAYVRRLLDTRYAVEAVANGAEALAAARAHPPDLVLTDIMMPGLDGFALLRELRADSRTATLPVILLSARAGEEATAAGLEAGADDYLVKPFAASELLARVQAHVALSRLRREARDALVAERDRLQAEVASRAQAEEALQRSHERLRLALVQLQTLQAISDAAFSQLALPALLRQVLAHVTAALEVDNTAILLLDETEETLVVHVAQGPEEVQAGQMRVPVGQGVAGRIAATRQPLILADLRAAEPVNPLLREQMASLMGVPLLVEGRLIGVMHVDSATPRRFTEDDLHLLQLVADRVALALDRARLYREALEARVAAEDLARQVSDERDRWRQVLDVLPVGVVIVDRHGRVEVLNQAGRDIVGHDTRGEPLPSPGEEVRAEYRVRRLDGTPYPPSEVPLWRSLLHGEEIRDDQQLHRHAVTGHETPLLVNSAPLRGPDGTIVGAVAVFQDITELRELEQAREEFLSSAAHDLKTPLTGIRGQAQLAQRRLARLDGVETAPVAEQLIRIQQGTDAMLALINELVDVTRLQMGAGLDLRRQPTDLVALVRDCVEAQQGAGTPPIVLEAQAPELVAEVDAARIARVVGNLLSNALKYSPSGGTIRVRVGREDGAALIVVQDEGIGIPAADLPHIFERFARAGNVAGYIQGTGIGLASARGIVEQHGGTIAAQSVEGHGATFTVRLPLEPA